MHGPTNSRCSGFHKQPAATKCTQPFLTENQPSPTTSPSEILSSTRAPFNLLKWIPRASRDQGATKLASILSAVVATNNCASWDRLLCFGARAFHVPIRGTSHVSLATLVNSHIKDEMDPVTACVPRPKMPKQKTSDSLVQLASRVSTKIEEGHFIGAVRLCVSEDTIAPFNDATHNSLLRKHPASPPDNCIPPLSNDESSLLSVSEEEVAEQSGLSPMALQVVQMVLGRNTSRI